MCSAPKDNACHVLSYFAMDDAAEPATAKLLTMMNNRIGNIEESLSEMRQTMREVRDYMTTRIVMSCPHFPRERYPEIDESIVDRVVTAVQQDARIVVERAWVILEDRGDHRGDHFLIVSLQLGKRVIAKEVSNEMNEHLVNSFGASYVSEWRATSPAHVERMCIGARIKHEKMYVRSS